MYRILLPIDDDEDRTKRAATVVADLPREPDDVAVVILNIDEPYSVGAGTGRVSSKEFFDEDDYPDTIGLALEILEDAGIDPEKRRAHGSPAEQILAVAEEIEADLIALSGRKKSPTGKVLFGSVTQSVLLDSDRPVVVA
ncbi:MAG: universal stress protein [Haloarculaceae archaeon]